MEHQNVYHSVNENPNIFPPSRSYMPQTHIRGDQDLASMNRQFQEMAFQQQQQQNAAFYGLGQQNMSNTNFAATRESRQLQSAPRSNVGYADTPSTYADYTSYDNDLEPTPSNLESDPGVAATQGKEPVFNEHTILQTNDMNSHALSHMAYPHAFTSKPFWQVPQKNLINDPDPSYLSIDSHDRDRTKYPNPNEYTIPLVSSDTTNQHGSVPGKRYKNVTSIELISAVIPNRANVLDEIYLILQVDEITDSTYDPLCKVFYPKPKASFDRITIILLKRDGTPFNFGTDNTLPAEVNPDLQNSFTFKITEKVVDVAPIGQRNI
jgi:hypothetical protein